MTFSDVRTFCFTLNYSFSESQILSLVKKLFDFLSRSERSKHVFQAYHRHLVPFKSQFTYFAFIIKHIVRKHESHRDWRNLKY